ncbi:hypothetical protein [Amycolatopsis sp. NPDC051128]|uniref:hypothetical protein n=1 Tax=Amycolatopsis sp. NPDC051128 TaxID=3155412 RepID=UPI003437BEA0
MKLRQRLGQVGAVVIITAAGVVGAASAADSANLPVFPVMNTSEQPPDGVWFRYGPDPSQTTRTTGVGVYRGEHVRVKCYTIGTALGPYSNKIWYYAYDVERPTAAGRSNEGWINTHYVDDGMTANHAHPSVPSCSGGGSTPAPIVKAVYFSPFNVRDSTRETWSSDPAVHSVQKDDWKSPKQCVDDLALGNVPSTATVLTGWSLGRLGPVYAIARASGAQRQQIDGITMIDPGNLTTLSGCDNSNILVKPPLTFRRPSLILADWLKANPSARLTILSGNITAENSHAGIQKVYFNDMRAAGIDRSRVLVCNYWGPGSAEHDHWEMYRAAMPYLNRILTTCPALTGLKQGVSWHP